MKKYSKEKMSSALEGAISLAVSRRRSLYALVSNRGKEALVFEKYEALIAVLCSCFYNWDGKEYDASRAWWATNAAGPGNPYAPFIGWEAVKATLIDEEMGCGIYKLDVPPALPFCTELHNDIFDIRKELEERKWKSVWSGLAMRHFGCHGQVLDCPIGSDNNSAYLAQSALYHDVVELLLVKELVEAEDAFENVIKAAKQDHLITQYGGESSSFSRIHTIEVVLGKLRSYRNWGMTTLKKR